jgi:predicted  nucleic acid-binding Zn-ribbon protein
MPKKTKKAEEKPVFHNDDADLTVERRLKALYRLQKIESEVDKIRIIRGELPLEVQDLEDDIEGLKTRIAKQGDEKLKLENEVSGFKNDIASHQELIKKYTTQQEKVKNNREYESLSKEIEYQNLEIQLCEKKIKEATRAIDAYKETIATCEKNLEEKKKDLDLKNSELEDIIKETSAKEEKLLEKAAEEEKHVEERYLTAFKRIRQNAKNGLAVVNVDRDACGGCFNQIAHQRQMDIKMHKKIIVCEFCGRILVDESITEDIDKEEF